MSYTKTLWAAALTASLLFSPAKATITVEEAKEWLTPQLQLKATKLLRIIDEERMTPIVNTPGQGGDYGYSFAGVLPIQQRCLKEIYTRYQQGGRRPAVLDAACGHGNMTWKMIVAGGHVIADELQEPTRLLAKETVKKAIPFLAEGEKLSQVTASCGDDLLHFDTCLAYKRTYDVTWSGNLLHLFTPKDATAYVENLFKITNGGGYAFAVANTPSTYPRLIERFLEEKAAGNPFPGYLVTNKINHRVYNLITRERTGRGIELTGDFPPAPAGMSITDPIPGFYQETSNEHRINDRTVGHETFYDYKSHCAGHYYDKESMTALFEKAGFLKVDVFFMDRFGKRYEGGLNPRNAERGPFAVGIVARKPLAPPPLVKASEPIDLSPAHDN